MIYLKQQLRLVKSLLDDSINGSLTRTINLRQRRSNNEFSL